MKSLINCRLCSEAIHKDIKLCPNCGGRNKGIAWGALAKSIIIVFSVVIALRALTFLFNESTDYQPSSVSTQASKQNPSIDEYAEANGLNYREALLDEPYKGQLFKFDGKVVQVMSDKSVRLATKKSSLVGYTGDDVYLAFSTRAKIVEGDIIQIKGRYNGTLSYKSIMGAKITVPEIVVDYYDVIKPRQ